MKNLISILLTASLFLFACNSNVRNEQLTNDKASLPESFNFDRLGLKVMTSFINKKTASMSILYANSIALNNALKGLDKHIADGEVFALITWKQQDDKNWFGAHILGNLQSVELIKTTGGSIAYQKYIGKNLSAIRDTLGQNARIKYILVQQPSIMP